MKEISTENRSCSGQICSLPECSLSKLNAELRERLRLEKTMGSISRIFASRDSVDINQVLEMLGKAVSVDRVYILKLHDKDKKISNIYEWCAPGIHTGKYDLQNIEMGRFPWLRKMVLNNKKIVISDITDFSKQATNEKRFFDERNVQSALIMPVQFEDGTVFGLIIFEVARKRRLWSREDIEILGIFRDILVSYWSRKNSRSELRLSYNKLEKTFDSIVHSLGSIVTLRDPYTADHQKRVSQLAIAIAREMKLKPAKINSIRMAGLLHDIGKINVPSEILNKPGKLTNIEFELIKKHTTDGYNILSKIDFGEPVAEIVLQHHERLDGSGYPNGLKGNEILLEAKILAVADVVEAISSHRPYRPALGLNTAFKEIEDNIKTKYDPDVVKTCVYLFKDKQFSLN